jgi:hypothetical protein
MRCIEIPHLHPTGDRKRDLQPIASHRQRNRNRRLSLVVSIEIGSRMGARAARSHMLAGCP